MQRLRCSQAKRAIAGDLGRDSARRDERLEFAEGDGEGHIFTMNRCLLGRDQRDVSEVTDSDLLIAKAMNRESTEGHPNGPKDLSKGHWCRL